MKKLIAEQFFEDPQVIKAQETLLHSLNKYKNNITDISPPDPARTKNYREAIDTFSRTRGTNLFFPYLSSGIGNGPLVELADGSIKYDFINGIGVHHFGHSHPALIKAALKASLGDTIMQGNLQQNAQGFHFSKKLLKAANAQGASLGHCFLSNTGVMAGENALKIAYQCKHPARRVLAFEKCFSGRTIAFSQITDRPAYRVGIPHTLLVDYVPFYNPDDPEKSIKHSISVIKKHIHRYPCKHTAMIFELVLGEGGFYEASKEFHRALMEICRDNDIAILVDEVQTFARTSQLFAFQHYELDDLVDIVWIGKASQVCATLFKKEFCPKPGLLSQTFTASSTAIAAAEVILDHLLDGNYFGPDGKIQELHTCFKNNLEAIRKKHPKLIQGPYGIGGMIAFTPFNGNAKKTMAFVKELFNNGVIAFLAGDRPSRVRFLLPIGAIECSHIDAVSKIIEQTLTSLSP